MTPHAVRLSALLAGAGIRPLEPTGGDPEVSGVGLDSRRVARGDLFLAIRGLTTDGERFVPQAVERGAVAVVAGSPRPQGLAPHVAWVRVAEPRRAAGPISRECFGRPDEKLTLVGVTGTNGKTTVVHLVESIARTAGRRTGRIGTVGHVFGDVQRQAVRTTPEAPDLFRMLAEMRDEAVELVAMEVSSHALALGRVAGVRFAVAAFLNLSRDHLDFHETEEAYFEAKATLFDALGAHARAVLPAGDPRSEALAARTRARVLRFGRDPGADVRLIRERCGVAGSTAVLETAEGALPIRTSLVGRFNLENVAAAACCALASGVPAQAIPPGVEAVAAVPGRMERVDRGQPFAVLVDYAHTDAALERVLTTVRELAKGRVLVVFGCGGDRDRGKRPIMGRVAAENADLVFLTSDNPRGEDPHAILGDVERGVASVPGAIERCRTIADRTEAIREAIAAAASGDAVVISGKGHETTQTLGDRVVPLDDRKLAADALAESGWRDA